MLNTISGVILAGGTNKRFGGKTKANIIVEGETIISRIILTISDLFDEIIIVTNTPEEFRGIGRCKIIKDRYLMAGPLGGIHAGLSSASGEAVFVFAGDMPFLEKEIIEGQISEFNKSNYDVLIPRTGTLIEPLHAIYRKSVLEDLERFLTEGKNKAVRDFLTEVHIGYYQVKETSKGRSAFTNINSPSDISRLKF